MAVSQERSRIYCEVRIPSLSISFRNDSGEIENIVAAAQDIEAGRDSVTLDSELAALHGLLQLRGRIPFFEPGTQDRI